MDFRARPASCTRFTKNYDEADLENIRGSRLLRVADVSNGLEHGLSFGVGDAASGVDVTIGIEEGHQEGRCNKLFEGDFLRACEGAQGNQNYWTLVIMGSSRPAVEADDVKRVSTWR